MRSITLAAACAALTACASAPEPQPVQSAQVRPMTLDEAREAFPAASPEQLYYAQVSAYVHSLWTGAEAWSGIEFDCRVMVLQDPAGHILAHEFQPGCTAPEGARASMEAALYAASPLRQPPNPTWASRLVEVRFQNRPPPAALAGQRLEDEAGEQRRLEQERLASQYLSLP